MAIIREPILATDCDWETDRIWCRCQTWWKCHLESAIGCDGMLICTAHIDEGRIFTCDFSGADDEQLVRCSDYQPIKGE